MWSGFKKQQNNRASSKFYLWMQDKWAKKMSSLADGLSKRSLICMLALFIILAGSISISNLCQVFSSSTSNSIKIEAISKPAEIVKKDSVNSIKNISISKEEFETIIRFSQHLDSLSQSPKGKRVYDSIVYHRHGLLDSLVFIENYYKSNFKK
jgi:hypothetical protein